VYFCKVTAISVFTEALGLLNGIGRGSVALAACVAITSCASQQRITLAQPAPVVASTDIIIQIVDLRDTRQRAFHAEGQPHCFRSYGDEFIAPSKVAYFREVLESRSAPHARANLTLSRFETVEFCDATMARVFGIGLAAAVGGVTGGKVALPEHAPESVGGDTFVLRIAGKINDAPFDVSKQFDYRDIKFTNFPSENPDYRKRIYEAIQSAVDEILAAGVKAAEPGR